MALVDRRTGIEIIDRRACLRLLANEMFGRVGVLDGGHPLILPVNYALDGDQVVFRTGEGTKLDALRGPACFEIDHHDDDAHTGWSVVVRGRLEPASADQQELAQPWAVEGDHALRIVPSSIRGRRVR